MGQLIDEEDCEVCVPFDQEWIFTYGDLVTPVSYTHLTLPTILLV